MTHVRFTRHNNTFSATIKGHADCDDNGRDPVCAACSILVNTLANHLDDMRKAGCVHSLFVTMLSGDATIRAKADPHAFDLVLEAFSFAEKGFDILETAHPEHVTLEALLGEK